MGAMDDFLASLDAAKTTIEIDVLFESQGYKERDGFWAERVILASHARLSNDKSPNKTLYAHSLLKGFQIQSIYKRLRYENVAKAMVALIEFYDRSAETKPVIRSHLLPIIKALTMRDIGVDKCVLESLFKPWTDEDRPDGELLNICIESRTYYQDSSIPNEFLQILIGWFSNAMKQNLSREVKQKLLSIIFRKLQNTAKETCTEF